MIAIDMKIPKDCKECIIRDIRNIFGTCPCDLELDERPSNCPLLEVCTLKVTSLAEGDEMKDWTEKFLINRMGQCIAGHPELMQTSNSDYTVPDELIKTLRRTEAYLNVVLPKGAKLNEQD